MIQTNEKLIIGDYDITPFRPKTIKFFIIEVSVRTKKKEEKIFIRPFRKNRQK